MAGLVYGKDIAAVGRVYVSMAGDGRMDDMTVTCIQFGDKDGSFYRYRPCAGRF